MIREARVGKAKILFGVSQRTKTGVDIGEREFDQLNRTMGRALERKYGRDDGWVYPCSHLAQIMRNLFHRLFGRVLSDWGAPLMSRLHDRRILERDVFP
jgi:hypothetical protein